MTKPHRTPQQIVHFRTIRPVLDFVILVAAMAVLIHLLNLEFEHKLSQKPKLNIQKTVRPNQTLVIEENFKEETGLWQSWNAWIHSNQPGAGHCLIETRPESINNPFYLLCFGKVSSGGNLELPDSKAWLDNNLFVKPEIPAPPPTEKSRSSGTDIPYTVQGWINTKTGRKNFDPVQGKWVP